jgi:hypothetical protein
MGERVVVNRRADERPAESPPTGAKASADPAPKVPLDYGHGSRAEDAILRIIAMLREWVASGYAALRAEVTKRPRQLIFAIGLMCLAGGFADALSRNAGGVFAASIGGLLIGLVLPIAWRKG